MSRWIVVPVSSGADSQVCLELAIKEVGADFVIGLFHDTRWEHPIAYEHLDKMRRIYNVEIVETIGSVEDEVLKSREFPSSGTRFCTSRLKIRKSSEFYKQLSSDIGAFEVWVGIRTDESEKRKRKYGQMTGSDLYEPHEVNAEYPKMLGKRGVRFRFPILEWTKEDVMQLLGDKVNPLYSMGQDRVGCFPCLASGIKKHRAAFNMDEFGRKQKARIIALEVAIGKKHSPAETDQHCLFCVS